MKYQNVLKSITFTIVLSFSMVFFSCSKDDLTTNNPQESNAALNALLERGFKKELIQDRGSFFIIEEDMVFSKETIRKKSELNKITQRYPGAEHNVNRSKASNIRVLIDQSISSWSSEIASAISKWNNGGSLIHFDIVTSSPDITIYSDQAQNCPSELANQPPSTGGMAFISWLGVPGYAIAMNMDSYLNNTESNRIGDLAHEFGHTINFAHTNNPNYYVIPGTPESDLYSLMNSSPITNNPSNWDLVALKIMYPLPPIISYFSQSPDPIYNGGNGYVYVYLSQASGLGDETYSWYAASTPSNITLSITPDGNRCYVHYYTPFGTLPSINLTCVVSNSGGTDVESYSVHCAL